MTTAFATPGMELIQELSGHLDRCLPYQQVADPPSSAARDRRSAPRTALPLLLRLWPLDDGGLDQAITVVGKDLSGGGVAFFHHEPLPYRRVMVEFDHPVLDRLSVELELTRCRFSKLNWYESAGRVERIQYESRATPLAG